MNRFKFILKALMVLSVISLWNCSKEDPEKDGPQLTVAPESLQFEADGEIVSQEINISTNRDWSASFVESNASEWAALDVSKGSGDAVVKVSVLPNKGTERTATVKITASVLSANVKITQLANSTIAKVDTLYFENCGTTVAKDGSYWPYVDQFTGWSRKGTLDQSAVIYSGSSSNVSNSGSAFDPAEGSNLSKPPYVGMNKNTSKFIINSINIKGNDNLTLKFGGIFQSAYSGGATFGEIKSGDFKLYAGFDGSKYAELGYTTESAGGNWYWIKSEFKVPAGTEKLYVKIETTNIGSNQGYRFDDFTIINVGEGSLINPDGGVTPPTLSFGTPVFSATTIKEKIAIEGGKIIIPYDNAAGTEKYTVSVVVSGTAANGINPVSNIEVALTKGSGNIEIAITGTPENAGSVTFEINGIDALSTKTVKANVSSATAANYDSNVVIPEDGANSVYTTYNGADLLVKINGSSYKCVKFGTSKKTGIGTTAVLPKTGDTKLTFYAYGWKGKKGALKITVNNGGTINGNSSVTTDAINGNDGCTGNGPFELSSVDSSALLSYELKDITDKTTITIESTKENGATDPRVVIFAINIK